MPNISAHMVVAKKVGEKLNITSDDFIRGNLLPDIIDMKDSHHKVSNGIYLVPNIKYYLKKLDLTNDLHIGYLVHLLLDKYYLEDYISKIYPNRNVFLDRKIYRDYDYINNKLVKKYSLNIKRLEKILLEYDCKILKEKLKYNIECLKQTKSGKLKYLDFNSFSQFLLDVSKTISKELADYERKSSKLYIHTR